MVHGSSSFTGVMGLWVFSPHWALFSTWKDFVQILLGCNSISCFATQLWFETHLLWLWKTTKCSSIHILRKWIIKWALHSFWLFNQEFNDFRRNSAVQHFLRIVHCVYFHCCWGSNWFVLYYMVVHCEILHSSHILVLRTFDFIRIDFLCIENFFLFSRKTLPCQKSGFRFVFGVIIYVKDHCIMFFSYT